MSQDFPYGLGDGDAGSLEDLVADSQALTADCESLSVVIYRNLLKRIQILLDVSPFEIVSGFFKPPDPVPSRGQGPGNCKIRDHGGSHQDGERWAGYAIVSLLIIPWSETMQT